MEKPQRKKLRAAIYKKLVGDAPASLDPAILSDARQQVQALLLLPRIEMHDLTAAVQRIGADLPLKNAPTHQTTTPEMFGGWWIVAALKRRSGDN
jgi:hypothetical protein